ncbi:hypothetical protein Psi02_12580 [Planotetraspora silvatica]|uniref:DUF3558 domain-containing protein n=1 Tax=Planotetraspora silvatica TaxID=234614 RepID=A0A8J3UM74_9ACTN|nr:hypothetical protein [Planotetraspora silvatica]GII44834.1 hypothetical protein Psi02_12580 [Planotetraspora silvatica]
MRHSVSKVVTVVIAGAFLAGCGSTATPGESSASGASTKASAAAAAGDGQGKKVGCPLSAESLGQATSLKWELQEQLYDHPLETAESIKATVCLFTSAQAPQEGSDPLALRADVVLGADVARVRQAFGDSCSGFGGKLRDSGKGVVCERNKVVVEGLVGDDDRLVNVYLVNADKATATKLTPLFGKIVASVA